MGKQKNKIKIVNSSVRVGYLLVEFCKTSFLGVPNPYSIIGIVSNDNIYKRGFKGFNFYKKKHIH